MLLKCLLPPHYPHTSPPLFELSAPHLADDVILWVLQQLEQMHVAGTPLLYNAIEWLQGQEDLRCSSSGSNGGSSSRGNPVKDTSDSNDTMPSPARADGHTAFPAGSCRWEEGQACLEVGGGEAGTEPRIRAHVAAISHPAEVQAVMATLLESSRIRNASHNM
ncbi:MAG: hypothetical protein WDW36_008053 [Sanguina aurantia]